MTRTAIGKLPAIMASALLGAGLVACAGAGDRAGSGSTSGRSTGAGSPAASHGSTATFKRGTTEVGNALARYGHEASSADKRAITMLVVRYYRAAAADDGARACSLIYSIIAEAVPEAYGEPPGPPALRGTTCAGVLAKLFRQVPGQPPAVLAATEVTDVRVRGKRGEALLRSEDTPVGAIAVERELGVWKVASVIGRALPGTPPAPQEPSTQATTAASPTAAEPPGVQVVKDSNDGDDDSASNDDEPVVDYGHAASAPDQRAITALVRRYYSAAAAADGERACSAIYAVVAEAIPEDYERSPGPRGKTCAAVMSHVFKKRGRELAADNAALEVTRVRVEGDRGLALVFLGARPEPHVLVHRYRGVWKIKSLFELRMP